MFFHTALRSHCFTSVHVPRIACQSVMRCCECEFAPAGRMRDYSEIDQADRTPLLIHRSTDPMLAMWGDCLEHGQCSRSGPREPGVKRQWVDQLSSKVTRCRPWISTLLRGLLLTVVSVKFRRSDLCIKRHCCSGLFFHLTVRTL